MKEYNEVMKKGGYKILPKIAFKFSNDAEKFLNGITTNEISEDTNAFLNAFGKVIVFAYQKKINKEVFIIIEQKYEQEFIDHINKYIRFSKTVFEKLPEKVVHVIGDHRVGEIIFPQKIGYLTLLNKVDFDEMSDEVYNIIRIENNIPVQGIDFEHQMFLDTGLYDTVSFSKGCFLGQEVMARVHNLAKPNRKIVRILYDEIPNKVTVDGITVGEITSSCYSPKYEKYLVFAFVTKFDQKIDNGEILT